MPPLHDHCRIELRGRFDLNWADYLEAVQIQEQGEPCAIRNTTLIGRPRDLEACLGLLHMLVDRGFQVQAIEYRQARPGEAVVGDSRLQDSTDATPRPDAG
jgi:hypothetical protein